MSPRIVETKARHIKSRLLSQCNNPPPYSRPDTHPANILTMRSLSLCLVLGLVSLSLTSLPPSVMLEDLRDQVHINPAMFQNHEDFKSFDSKRVSSDGFWVRIL